MRVPETIKVVLKGALPDWDFAKDIVLWLAGNYSTSFALDQSVEYKGPAVPMMKMADRLCIATHTIELGGKFGIFEFDDVTKEYIESYRPCFDFSVIEPLSADLDAVYAREVAVDLSLLEPQVALPHSFDNVVPVSQVNGTKIHQVMIGSCANGRVEDMIHVARILNGKKVAKGTRLFVQPASWRVFRECAHNGTLDVILDAGGQVLNPGCHICLGLQGVMPPGENCISSCTRNFRGRCGCDEAFIYLSGPETAAAASLMGKIVDPREVM
jgi:3-isopropylmalate/(R)-2-methylmalate dehydratase large subunit